MKLFYDTGAYEKFGISGLHLVKLLENGKIHSRRRLEGTIFKYGF